MVRTTHLRRLRLKYHITLIDIAEAAGVKNQNLSDWERGETRVSPERQELIAQAFLRLTEERCRALQALICEINTHKNELLTPMEPEDEL